MHKCTQPSCFSNTNMHPATICCSSYLINSEERFLQTTNWKHTACVDAFQTSAVLKVMQKGHYFGLEIYRKAIKVLFQT